MLALWIFTSVALMNKRTLQSLKDESTFYNQLDGVKLINNIMNHVKP